MTWIKTVMDDRVREAMSGAHGLYPVEYATPVHAVAEGEAAGIVMSHSLIPDALHHAFSTFGVLMNEDLPLSRRDHELIAGTVSALNDCFY